MTRGEFKALASEGVVGPGTAVFDTSLTKIGDFRSGALERPAEETWHGKAFFKEALGA